MLDVFTCDLDRKVTYGSCMQRTKILMYQWHVFCVSKQVLECRYKPFCGVLV